MGTKTGTKNAGAVAKATAPTFTSADLPRLTKELTEAREAYKALGGRWQKEETSEQAAAGKRLIAARAAFRQAAGTGTVREAYVKTGFKPSYASRVRTIKNPETKKAKAAA